MARKIKGRRKPIRQQSRASGAHSGGPLRTPPRNNPLTGLRDDLFDGRALGDDTFSALNSAIESLRRGDVDDKIRHLILDALEAFFITLVIERDSHRRGRPPATVTCTIAYLAKFLMIGHGGRQSSAIDAAVRTMYPLVSDKEYADNRSQIRDRVRKEMNKIKHIKDASKCGDFCTAWKTRAESLLSAGTGGSRVVRFGN